MLYFSQSLKVANCHWQLNYVYQSTSLELIIIVIAGELQQRMMYCTQPLKIEVKRS